MTHCTALAWRWAFKAVKHGVVAWDDYHEALLEDEGDWHIPSRVWHRWSQEEATSYGMYFAGLVGELVRAGCYEDAAPAVALQMIYDAHQVAGRVTP